MGLIFKHLRGLGPLEISEIMTISKQAHKKIQRSFSKYEKLMEFDAIDEDLIVDIKRYKKMGNRVKYSIRTKFVAPSLLVTAKHADFELNKALRRTFDDLANALEKKIQVKGQYHRVKKR